MVYKYMGEKKEVSKVKKGKNRCFLLAASKENMQRKLSHFSRRKDNIFGED